MIAALIIGREGSISFPGKNTYKILCRPLMLYPMMAAKNSKYIDEHYFSTDSKSYKKIAKKNNWKIIDRPSYLTTKAALGEHAFQHGFRIMKDEAKKRGKKIELIVLLFCNAATILAATIDEGIRLLRSNKKHDSVVTVSAYNMWSPLRARRIDENGSLKPFVPLEAFGDPSTLNCDRDSQGDVWFADMGVSIVRTNCLEDLNYGLLPQRWMGQKIYPLKQWGGCDVDYEWQIPMVEYWLRKNGFSETTTPYDK